MDNNQVFEEVEKLVSIGFSVQKAAQKVARKSKKKVPAVLSAYYRRRPQAEAHGNSSLTAHEAKILLYALIAVSGLNLDWTLKQTQEAIEVMFDKKVSLTTVHSFKVKHAEDLSLKSTTSLGKKRSEQGIYAEVMVYIH